MIDRETRIRERARHIWEEEGRPEGRERDHWERAAREIAGEEASHQSSDHGRLDDPEDASATSEGSASGLQPIGTSPEGGPGVGAGNAVSGGSTAGATTDSLRKPRR